MPIEFDTATGMLWINKEFAHYCILGAIIIVAYCFGKWVGRKEPTNAE